MLELGAWDGRVVSRNDEFRSLTVVAPSASNGSWSGPFRAIASDQNDYFVKSLETCPPGQQASLAIELIVARAGKLIGAPVVDTTLIRIPQEIAGYEPVPGKPLNAGLAHASRALEHADEAGRPNLASRDMDHNSSRHVGVYALFDWCFGSDQQWLYDIDNERTLYSHDHGLYLPPSTGTFDRASLVSRVDEPHPLPDSPEGLSAERVQEVALALEAVQAQQILDILNDVPTSWPVSDADLEALGWFLYRRAAQVAQRLRLL